MDAPLVMHVLSMAHGSFVRKSHRLKMEKNLHRVGKSGKPDVWYEERNLRTHRISKLGKVQRMIQVVASLGTYSSSAQKSFVTNTSPKKNTDHNERRKRRGSEIRGTMVSFYPVMSLLHPFFFDEQYQFCFRMRAVSCGRTHTKTINLNFFILLTHCSLTDLGHCRLRQLLDQVWWYFHHVVSPPCSFFPMRSVVSRMQFPMISSKKFTSICPMIDEGQHICSEGLVSPSVLLLLWSTSVLTFKLGADAAAMATYLLQECAVRRFETLLRDHIFQPSETTPDTPTDVLPKNGCILMK
jgi:hypothetical protein